MQLNTVNNGGASETVVLNRSWSLSETLFERVAMASTDADKVRRIKRVVELWRTFKEEKVVRVRRKSDSMMVAVEAIVNEESAENLVVDRGSETRRKVV